jgi:hypothetical protein
MALPGRQFLIQKNKAANGQKAAATPGERQPDAEQILSTFVGF